VEKQHHWILWGIVAYLAVGFIWVVSWLASWGLSGSNLWSSAGAYWSNIFTWPFTMPSQSKNSP